MSATTGKGPMSDEILRNELTRREIRLTGDICSDTVHITQVKLAYLVEKSKKPITIWLNTPGGGIMDGLSLYDSIMSVRKAGVKVHIVATGSCMSMGAIIMQAATSRQSTTHTGFLLHELHMVNIGSLGQLSDKHKEAMRLQNVLNDILMKRSGLSKQQLQKLTERRDFYLSAAEAKQFGLIDNIL